MSQDLFSKPLVRFALRLAGCAGLAAVAYFLLLLPKDAEIATLASDKVGHVAVGFTIALSLHALFFGRRRLFVLIAAIVLAAMSEIGQQFVGRDAELLDFVADIAGALVYLVLVTGLARLWR